MRHRSDVSVVFGLRPKFAPADPGLDNTRFLLVQRWKLDVDARTGQRDPHEAGAPGCQTNWVLTLETPSHILTGDKVLSFPQIEAKRNRITTSDARTWD